MCIRDSSYPWLSVSQSFANPKALRHSFGTLLSTSGVEPRVAQAAMRHSKIDLTMNVYTDPRLLDVHGALNALPGLLPKPADDNQQATGTDCRRLVPPNVPPRIRQNKLIRDNSSQLAESAVESENKKRLAKNRSSSESDQWTILDLNQRPPRCQRGALAN